MNVTSIPVTQMNGEIVTQFVDVASSLISYEYPTQKERLIIKNRGIANITLNVGEYSNQVITPLQTWSKELLFDSFTIQSSSGTQEFIATAYDAEMVKFTSDGGLAIKLMNKTGSNTIKGSVVTAGSLNNSFILQSSEYEAIGTVLESGIADGLPCWVVVSGIGYVLLEDGTASTVGNGVKASAVDGRATALIIPTNLGAQTTAEHFKEIGHSLEAKIAGTSVLCKIVLHFN